MRVTRAILILLALVLALPMSGALAQDVMDPATFGLDASKPYDGTELKFLICCSTAPQFASAAAKGAAEFTAMTGISVSWGDLPFGSFQEQLYLEATNPNTEFDIVAFVDAWGTNIYDFLHPLNDFVADAGIDWDDYGPPISKPRPATATPSMACPSAVIPCCCITAPMSSPSWAWTRRRTGRMYRQSGKPSRTAAWISRPSPCITA